MSIQVYGSTHDFASFSNVTRALARELRRHRADAQVYPVGALPGGAEWHVEEVALPVGLDGGARVGVYVGYPESSAGWLNGHAERVLMTVCETDRIPDTWVEACNAATLVVVPSEWCRAAFLASGVQTPVEVVRHGVWPLEPAGRPWMVPAPDPAKELVFLHVSGALTFAERKGTAQLLRAFRAFVDEHENAHLLLKMPHTEGVRRAIVEAGLEHRATLVEERSYEPYEMAGLYRRVHAVVQPSRAEGFGLVPLEARAVGTPVLVTHCTGHLEHAHNSDVVVVHGRSEPLETQANPVGAAPTVSVSAVKGALDTLVASLYNRRRLSLENAKCGDFRKWQWQCVLASFVAQLKSRDGRRHVRLGGSAGLRGTS